MISKWLFSGAFVFELGSWGALFQEMPIGAAALLFVSAHGISSALLAAGVWLLLPNRYKFPLPWSPLFIFSLSFFVPVLGAIGVAIAVFPALYMPRTQKEQAWDAIGVPDLPFRPQERSRDLMFQDGGLQDVLRHAPSAQKRVSALFATRRMPSKDSIPILKLALRDPADDVRLLAYSMLDRQESEINHRIQVSLQQLADATGAHQAAVHATLARWYWELAYLGLAQGSVLEHVLKQAREHVNSALAQGASDDSHLLAARISMEMGDLEQAEQHLLDAQTAGIDLEKLLPFMAEIAFSRGDYTAIAQLLRQLPDDMLKRPPFAALARYWL